MTRLTLLLFLAAALLGACENRPVSEFYLLRITETSAQVVDFSDVKTDDAGIKRMTIISVTKAPFSTPEGEPAQYGRSRFAFDCPNHRYRGEGMAVFGPDFTKVDEVRETTPWHAITNYRGLQEDFRRFCETDPQRSDLSKLSSSHWEEAAKSALGRFVN